MAAVACKNVSGVSARVSRPSRSARAVVCRAEANSRREIFALGAALLSSSLLSSNSANASVIDDLLKKSADNKAVNDKKRLATSNANVARGRTIADGTCGFPTNFFGCEEVAFSGPVKFIAEDLAIECEGKEKGKCASRVTGFQKK